MSTTSSHIPGNSYWDTLKYNLTPGKFRWNPDKDIHDLTGKVAIVTGATAGLGLITTEKLVQKNAKVYLLARSPERVKKAIADITQKIPHAESLLEYIYFDLTDIKSAQEAAKTFLAKEKRLDFLINNAGIMAWPYQIKNGVEIQFSNHIGHYALTIPLLDILKETAKLSDAHPRIVNVSSVANTFSPVPDFTSIEAVNRPFNNTWERYGQSKLANIVFTQGLVKHLKGTGVRALSIHPGVVNTELTRGLENTYTGAAGKIFQYIYSFISLTPLDGTKNQLWAATSPVVDAKDYNGQFFYPVGVEWTPKPIIADPNNKYVDQLWELSAKIVNSA